MSKPTDAYLANHPYCQACGAVGTVTHHIKTRGSGGADGYDNFLSLCPRCHRQFHRVGHVEFGARYPHLLTKIQRAVGR